MRRRRLLAVAATATTPLAGCSSGQGETSPRVSADSQIREQPTDDHPAAISFSLANETDDPITVSANRVEPFFYVPRLAGPGGFIVLNPVTDYDLWWDVARSPTNGCWRFVDRDGHEMDVEINTGLDRLTLQPGRTHRVTHQLYYQSETSACFPDGRYDADHTVRFHDPVTTADIETRVAFNLKARVSNGRISALDVHRYEDLGPEETVSTRQSPPVNR